MNIKKFLSLAIFFILSWKAQSADFVSISSLKPIENEINFSVKEKKLLLYFWASWCPDCREKFENGTLDKLQGQFPQVKFLTINSDRDSAKGLSYMKSEKIKLPVLRDQEKALTKQLKLFAVPAWAILVEKEKDHWEVINSSTGSDLTAIQNQLERIKP